MKITICPICHQKLMMTKINKSHQDYNCVQSDDHFYAYRWNKPTQQITILKFRLDNLITRINIIEGFSQVWIQGSDERAKINYIIIPDFSDLEKIKQKIKTYLTFS